LDDAASDAAGIVDLDAGIVELDDAASDAAGIVELDAAASDAAGIVELDAAASDAAGIVELVPKFSIFIYFIKINITIINTTMNINVDNLNIIILFNSIFYFLFYTNITIIYTY